MLGLICRFVLRGLDLAVEVFDEFVVFVNFGEVFLGMHCCSVALSVSFVW